MKKLVLVVISAVLMGIFIAFNYLLWDRENKLNDIKTLESSKAIDDASLSALGREIKNLEDENKLLKEKIDQLEASNQQVFDEKSQVEKDRQDMAGMLAGKDDTIFALKQLADTTDMEEPIKKWVEGLGSGNYKAAYELYNRDLNNPDVQLTAEQFADSFKNTVKGIQLKDLKLFIDKAPPEKKGDLVFIIALEVNNVEGVDKNLAIFDEGMNERYITVEYDTVRKSWSISKISPVP